MNEIIFWKRRLAKLMLKTLENDEHIAKLVLKTLENDEHIAKLVLKTLENDEHTLKDIDEFIWEYNQQKARQKVVESDLPMTVKVLEAISQLGYENNLVEGEQLFLKSVAERVNQLIDSQVSINSRRVGEIMRNSLQLNTKRWTRGKNKGLYYMVWDMERLKLLCGKYGVEFGEVKNERA